MDERERAARLEDARRCEHVGGFGSLGLLQVGQLRGLGQFAALEHGDGAREPPGRLRQTGQPEAERASDRARADPLDARRRGGVGSDALLREGLDERS